MLFVVVYLEATFLFHVFVFCCFLDAAFVVSCLRCFLGAAFVHVFFLLGDICFQFFCCGGSVDVAFIFHVFVFVVYWMWHFFVYVFVVFVSALMWHFFFIIVFCCFLDVAFV